MHAVLRRNDDGIRKFRAFEHIMPVGKAVYLRNIMLHGNTVAEEVARFRNSDHFRFFGHEFDQVSVDRSPSTCA